MEMNLNPEDIQVLVLNDFEYANLINICSTDEIKDDFAFSLIIDEKPIIILRDVIEQFPFYVHKAIIAHELAHLHGIIDEEKADRWALKYLNDSEAEQFLIENWKLRHGKVYQLNEGN